MQTGLKQVAALPIRRNKGRKPDVMLVTSRETGRWVIPKGWPSKKIKDNAAAAREARQEAGVTGKISKKPIGYYRYKKRTNNLQKLVYVNVFLLEVKKEKKVWLEKKFRHRRWFDNQSASRKVREPKLKDLLSNLHRSKDILK
ncbi:MAG: NUDIX hydrolase [Hyphomicrobium sp.]